MSPEHPAPGSSAETGSDREAKEKAGGPEPLPLPHGGCSSVRVQQAARYEEPKVKPGTPLSLLSGLGKVIPLSFSQLFQAPPSELPQRCAE